MKYHIVLQASAAAEKNQRVCRSYIAVQAAGFPFAWLTLQSAALALSSSRDDTMNRHDCIHACFEQSSRLSSGPHCNTSRHSRALERPSRAHFPETAQNIVERPRIG